MRTSLWRRPFGLLLLPLALIVCSLSGSDRADADGSRHPYFDDQGTLRWYHSIDAAKSAAQRDGKLIFVEYGRKRCSNCKKLAERVLPHSQIRGRLSSMAIGLAAECDTPEHEVYHLFRRYLPNARSLPFVAILTPRGRWITGWAGYTRVGDMAAQLSVAQRTHARILAKRRADGLDGGSTTAEGHGTSERSPEQPTSERPVAERGAQPAPKPQPCTPMRTEPTGREPLGDNEEDDPCDPCADGSCDYNPCKPVFENPFAKLFKKKCKPCPQPTRPEPTRPERTQPTASAAAGTLATKPGAQPAPRATSKPAAKPALAVGSPDGDGPPKRVEGPKRVLAIGSPDAVRPEGGFPAPALQPRLPEPRQPERRATSTAAAPRVAAKPTARPAAKPVASPRTTQPTVIAAAIEAADKDDWGTVLELTRTATKKEQPALFELNRQAHAWAHKQLATAVRSIRARRYQEAHDTVTLVQTTMRGEAAAVDAERGAEAIELMRDLDPLREKSLVRRTVRKTAYEKMRGTRWAPLFSPVPQPGAAVATK